MKFDLNNPVTIEDKTVNALILRFQKNQSDFSKNKAVKYAKENWALIGEDFQKACYWVFGRETFVLRSAGRGNTSKASFYENAILKRQEVNHEDLYNV